ncbi:MAG: RluA family pseudouridine synthase [Planctomycetota bacterium]|jgi:tRNA pseudouridine32 synthase/23S rRNA pseudouridine746 synthase
MLDVLYHDDRVLVLNKPAGLLSVPGRGPDKRDSLADRAARQRPGARIVHRLDRETSGVMVMALDPEAHRELSRQFQQRAVAKRYVAVVAGVVDADQGEIDLPLRKDLDHPPRHMVDRQLGRRALTRWRVLCRHRDQTRLELRPVTGRSHQLRLHLKAMGNPILGDDLYAPRQVAAMADRLLLHAQSLAFDHPATGDRMTFVAECPF